MDYTQERVTTLHDFGGADPDAPVADTVVVVPMTEREYTALATEAVLGELERLQPKRVVVPLRAPAERAPAFAAWLDGFDLPLDVLWCTGPRVADRLADAGLGGDRGKGRDIWLALGYAADLADYVVVHDADTTTYEARDVRKLLFPLTRGFDFSKGYYARVENARLYGRLCRLFYEPLVAALDAETANAPVVDYLGAFRYALAGECAFTADLAQRVRVRRRWGLEVGLLAEAYHAVGADAVAQVDLGRYEHDHRAVSGPSGLTDMSDGVGAAVLQAVEADGVTVDYDALTETYRDVADRFVRAYATDAAFNGFDHGEHGERDQVDAYADAIAPPSDADTRLPAWTDAPLDADAVVTAARDDLAAARSRE